MIINHFFIEWLNCNQYACRLGMGRNICMYMHRYFKTYQYLCLDVVFDSGIVIYTKCLANKFEREHFVNVTGCPIVENENFHGYEL